MMFTPSKVLWRAGAQRSTLGRLCLALGLVGGLCGMFNRGQAEAALSSCRSDPVVVVNGATVDIVDTLWTDASAVRELDYTITVPSGSLTGKTTLTVGLGFPETVTYVRSSSQARGTMKVAATIQTQRGTPPFQTTLQATTLTSLLTGTSTASGRSNSTVTVTLTNMIMV
jgi:hypothetical protein